MKSLGRCEMVVTLSPFKANMQFSDVLLPIAPFTETSGTFVNAEGRAQSFHAVVKPLGDTRPAWKVLRVLANMLDVPGMAYESSQEVLEHMHTKGDGGPATAPEKRLSNACQVSVDLTVCTGEPAVAGIYQLDGIVRRASSLQLTADARAQTNVSSGEGVLS